jgi:ATP-binding cassette subfamily B protein
MAGRTTIMITHDLNLAPDADRILVVDRGRIVESGRHEELLARGGAYARLHRSQNNAVTDTGELRMPLFTEGFIEAPAAVGEPAYGHQGYGSYGAWQAPSYAYDQYVPPQEEPWPGV